MSRRRVRQHRFNRIGGGCRITDTVLCLVGRGLGYQIYTEQISFAGGNAMPLTQKGIDSASVVVSGTIPVSGIPTHVTSRSTVLRPARLQRQPDGTGINKSPR